MDFESDPAAEFLSREKEELAGIIDDNEGLLSFALLPAKFCNIIHYHCVNHCVNVTLLF